MPGEFRELPKESRLGDTHTADFGEHISDVYKLINLAGQLKVEEIDIPSLENFKENKYWIEKDGKSTLGAYEIVQEYVKNPDFDKIIKNHPEWQEEIEKIKKADYENYPIILIGDVVIDGMHRLTEAWISGASKIKVKKFEKLPKETIIPK